MSEFSNIPGVKIFTKLPVAPADALVSKDLVQEQAIGQPSKATETTHRALDEQLKSASIVQQGVMKVNNTLANEGFAQNIASFALAFEELGINPKPFLKNKKIVETFKNAPPLEDLLNSMPSDFTAQEEYGAHPHFHGPTNFLG